MMKMEFKRKRKAAGEEIKVGKAVGEPWQGWIH